MKILSVVIIAIVSCTTASCAANQTAASPEDTPQSRRQAAEEYLHAVSPEDIIQDTAAEIAKTLPESERAAFLREMIRDIDMTRINTAILDSLVKTFTVAELRALTQFYGSREGKAIMKKFGVYIADVMPVIQAEATKATAKAMEAVK